MSKRTPPTSYDYGYAAGKRANGPVSVSTDSPEYARGFLAARIDARKAN